MKKLDYVPPVGDSPTTSYNGAPLIPNYGHPSLSVVEVPGTRVKLRAGVFAPAAPLFQALGSMLNDIIRLEYKKDDPSGDTWAYTPKPAAHTGSNSCHASGTAVDLWANREGRDTSLGASSLTTAQATRIVDVLDRFRAKDGTLLFRWLANKQMGGAGNTIHDPMHFELSSGQTTMAALEAARKHLKIKTDGVIMSDSPLLEGKTVAKVELTEESEKRLAKRVIDGMMDVRITILDPTDVKNKKKKKTIKYRDVIRLTANRTTKMLWRFR